MKPHKGGRLFWLLNVLFLVQWVALSFNVHNRQAWVLENILVWAFAIPVAAAYLRGWISDTSYVLLFVFFSLHNIGAHYTYSLVPYDNWSQSVTGSSISGVFGWKRNHYDRLLHFLFGFLLFKPIVELTGLIPRLALRWRPLVALLIVIGWSSLYELLEWAAAIVFADGAGPEYVGTQGDPWDAQKDQALAVGGAILSWIVLAVTGSVRRTG